MLFRDSAAAVAAECHSGALFFRLTEQFVHVHGHKPGSSEVRSWERSIPVLASALNDAGLGQVEMLLEYGLPLNSKRADAVLAGVHPKTGLPSYVIVELKQWSQAELYEGSERIVLVEGMHRLLEHPLLQVQGYCDYICDFVASLRGNESAVRGVAYLHNAVDLDVEDL